MNCLTHKHFWRSLPEDLTALAERNYAAWRSCGSDREYCRNQGSDYETQLQILQQDSEFQNEG